MPTFPPERVDLSSPPLKSWLGLSRVTENNPDWVGRVIRLKDQPYVNYDAYDWVTGNFKAVANSLDDIRDTAGSGYVTYTPIALRVQGQIATDKTDYRSKEAPHLSDYTITQRVEYYLDGNQLITNVPLDSLGLTSSAVTVTYTHMTDGVRLHVVMRTNRSGEADQSPRINRYRLDFITGFHPKDFR